MTRVSLHTRVDDDWHTITHTTLPTPHTPHPPQGKRLRPTILLLMASALSPVPTASQYLEIDLRPPSEHPSETRRQLQRIAEITELIHVASLLHDDVLDDADTRRGVSALNAVFGNKVGGVLGAGYLHAHVSLCVR